MALWLKFPCRFRERRGKVVDIGGRMNKIATKIFSAVQYLDGLQEDG